MKLVKWQLVVLRAFNLKLRRNKDNAEVAESAEDAEKRKSTARNRCATGRRETQEAA
jgi:hypothetical protein